jgi:flavodoxin
MRYYLNTLVIYYSFEGNTRLIAETIAEAANADILELRVRDDIKPGAFMKYVWGGREVVWHKRPDLLPFEKDPAGYDLLFIGTPVWAWTFSPALRTLFSSVRLRGKKIALFCCHGGSIGKTFERMSAQLSGNTILGTFDLMDPLKNDKEQNMGRAKDWAAEILSKAK